MENGINKNIWKLVHYNYIIMFLRKSSFKHEFWTDLCYILKKIHIYLIGIKSLYACYVNESYYFGTW